MQSRPSFNLAALIGDFEAIRYYVEEEKIDVNKKVTFISKTALELAAESGHMNIVDYLLQNNAEMSAQVLIGATENDHFKVVSFLCVHESVKNHATDFKFTAFCTAVRMNKLKMAELLITFGANVNKNEIRTMLPYSQTDSPLIVAAMEGHSTMVDLLLMKGAEIEYKNERGNTALIIAAEEGRLDVVCVLVKFGALVEQKNSCGCNALMLASKNGHTNVVRFLLSKNADVNEKSNRGYTSLMFACTANSVEIVQMLIEAGVTPSANSEDNYNALTCSLLAKTRSQGDLVKKLEIVRQLLQNKEKTDVYLSEPTRHNLPIDCDIIREFLINGVRILPEASEIPNISQYKQIISLLTEHKEEQAKHLARQQEMQSFFSSDKVPSQADKIMKSFLSSPSFFKLVDDYARPSKMPDTTSFGNCIRVENP